VSKDEDKIKHSRRLARDTCAIRKQVKIAKAHGIQPRADHRYAKHHSMNCGRPHCVMCSNPRKIWKEKTIQEKRKEQQRDDE
jgi:hypothetical protein